MNRLSIILALFLFLGFNSAFAQSETKNEKKENKKMEMNHEKMDHKMNEEKAVKPWNEVCPVKGNKVQEGTVTVNYKGKDYGFCCPGCDSKFEKNPAKYSKNLSKDGTQFIGKK